MTRSCQSVCLPWRIFLKSGRVQGEVRQSWRFSARIPVQDSSLGHVRKHGEARGHALSRGTADLTRRRSARAAALACAGLFGVAIGFAAPGAAYGPGARSLFATAQAKSKAHAKKTAAARSKEKSAARKTKAAAVPGATAGAASS